MATYLTLNQNQVFNGLGTVTYTNPTTGNYNVRGQITVPQAVLEGDGAGSGTGLGAGRGGGGEGFVRGGAGTGLGGVGQGFGATGGYQQPPDSGSNEATFPAVSSALTVVVNVNGSPIYTAPVFRGTQSALQFKTSFQSTATDSITIVLASANASDAQLNGVQSNFSIGQGFF